MLDRQRRPSEPSKSEPKLRRRRSPLSAAIVLLACVWATAAQVEAHSEADCGFQVQDKIEAEQLGHADLHRLMSEQDLRRTFQVATHEQVPEYEVFKLTTALSELPQQAISAKSDSAAAAAAAAETLLAGDGQQRRRSKRSVAQTKEAQQAALEHDNKLIVINLSTFGRDFKLRLKRNADFQQRIKDMKMLLVESTADGQLRYTVEALLGGGGNASGQGAAPSNASQDTDWSVGQTYHDEENLAALLVGRDKRTGELQLDGTIGNDFVIKPMPKAALELFERRQREQRANLTSGAPELQQAADSSESARRAASGELERQARNMHADDPHDDDEMFLDEDEALELALTNERPPPPPGAKAKSSNASEPQQWQAQKSATGQSAARTLSKEASELKWRKYRKLMAQTQVPKQLASRARRHTNAELNRVSSHHIVYRQRPSAESSTEGHRHSFVDFAESMARELHSAPAGRLQRLAPFEQATTSDEDPLGGQFYLEAGEPADAAHWSLVGSYVNASRVAATTSGANGQHARVKRQANARTLKQQAKRHKRQAPDTVWPEVLLVVDYDSFLLHGGDSRDVKRYFVSFWNGVDLRYKLLVHPHIRISLAGMIVAKDRDATPYLERNRLRAPNADAVDAAGALTDMGKYLYREDRLPTYDLAVVITKLDMCRRRYEGGRCNRGTAGFAYVGGACVVNKRLEKVNSVAIIEDSGGFSGIIVAAHEVGHLLGCVHDGSPPPSYLGGPGATHCPWEDGFIMSDLRHTERGFRWSQCSVEQFKHFLNGETATCLYNYPHESQMLHRLLPGTMLSLDEQCKRDRGTNACFKDARVCAQLFCFDSASGYCVSYRPAAEGSPCGEGQVCRNGKCVGEIENIIPDYTHQSQTVVASNGNALGPPMGTGRAPPHLLAAPAALPPVGRVADNGLSASSTSSATSAPDAKQAGGATPQASSRRMDSLGGDAEFAGAGAPRRAAVQSQRSARLTSAADGPHTALSRTGGGGVSLAPGAHHLRRTTAADNQRLHTSGVPVQSAGFQQQQQQQRHAATRRSAAAATSAKPLEQQRADPLLRLQASGEPHALTADNQYELYREQAAHLEQRRALAGDHQHQLSRQSSGTNDNPFLGPFLTQTSALDALRVA